MTAEESARRTWNVIILRGLGYARAAAEYQAETNEIEKSDKEKRENAKAAD
jgi:hypothetical protein